MTTRSETYTVGWICAIPTEFVVACELLDEEYGRDRAPKVDIQADSNSYTFGRIHEHNVVISCLPKGRYGITSAAIVAERMRRSFPAIRFGLMVGIAGGAPSHKHDIRLGDVVVSSPTSRYAGVLQYDFGKAINDHVFEETGHMAPPPDVLLNAMASLETQHRRKGHRITETITKMLVSNKRIQAQYSRPDAESDRLYETSLDGQEQLVTRAKRQPEDDDPAIHYGLIASANQVMKNRKARDVLIEKHDVLCFEMEAAGLMNNFPCLVIRSICDYSDMHKNDEWQGYAAATAAAYAKELLEVISGNDIESLETVEEASKKSASDSFKVAFSLDGVPVAKEFVKRQEEMLKLDNALLPKDGATRRIFVLRGLGGIGKTQLAVNFMRSHQDIFTAVLWLNGNSKDSVKRSIAQYAKRISPHQISDSSRNYANTGQGNIDTVIREVIGWLNLPGNDRWLMVFDNVDRDFVASDPDSDPLSYNIRSYIPDADHGSILITTRLAQLETLGKSHEVERVDDQTAKAILNTWHNSSHNEESIKSLLTRLDGLPLAIAQAGSYLRQSGVSIDTYLRLYDQQSARVAEALHKSDRLLDDYAGRSVWTTWNISYDAIFMKDKHVANLLVLWSFLDRNDLYFSMFERASKNRLLAMTLYIHLGDIADDEVSFIGAMSLLRDYSLTQGAGNALGYAMHTVVHRWVYFYHGMKHLDIGLLALRVVVWAIPSSHERDYVRTEQRLLPHANMCSYRFVKIDGRFSQNHSRGNWFVFRIFQIGQADNEIYLNAIHKLGLLYYTRDKPTEAQEMLLRALQGYEKAFGAKDKSTLQTVNNLGNLYSAQGKLAEAEGMYVRALQGYEETLGAKHRLTLQTVNNLGGFYRSSQCKLAEAEELYMRALRGFEETFGPKYVSTILAVKSLGSLYRDQGKLAEAEEMYMRALRGLEEALGAKHTATLSTVHNLGLLYRDQGKLVEAEEMYVRALRGYEEVLGIECVKTYTPALDTMSDLGQLYSETRPNESQIMYTKALSGYTIVYGEFSKKCLDLKRRLDHLDISSPENTTKSEPGISPKEGEDKPLG